MQALRNDRETDGSDHSDSAAGLVELVALVGFFAMYIVVGVVPVGLTALFYHHIEVTIGNEYSGAANPLALIHLVLMNVGIAAATCSMIYAGYFGDTELWPISQGGMEWTMQQVAEQIVAVSLSGRIRAR